MEDPRIRDQSKENQQTFGVMTGFPLISSARGLVMTLSVNAQPKDVMQRLRLLP